jgi:hypothetical protein
MRQSRDRTQPGLAPRPADRRRAGHLSRHLPVAPA